MKREIKISSDKNKLILESAAYIADLIEKSIKEKDRCTFVLSGGSTPKDLYETLASEKYRAVIDWSKVHVFWGDERCVPPDHPDSNYRMAKEALIDHVDIPQENVYRIPAEKEPVEAAREYEETIKKIVGGSTQFPVFDIILLGIGEDGHTASLFPGTMALEEKKRWVTEVFVPKFDAYRISLTLPVINNGKNIIFLVAGEAKSDVVNQVYNRIDTTSPSAQVDPINGNLVYLLDKSASAKVVYRAIV
jgi:6-phosphogluconolactonase